MPLSCCHHGRLQLLPARLALAKAAVISSAHRQQQLSTNHQFHSHIRQRRQLLVQSCNHSDKVMSQPRPGYRKNVGVCLVNQQGLVFAGRRPKVDTPWQLPQGGIDEGESPGEAAARELQEETGILQASIISQANCWLDYDFPAGHRGWGNFPGQTQMWFLMLYHGDGSDINLNQHDPPEFDSFQWMSLQDLPSQVVPFKRKIYEELARQFVPVIDKMLADQG